MDVAAPGENLVSLHPDGEQLIDTIGRDGPISGTSYAAPVVAGVAALVRSRFPQLSAREVMHRIEDTARTPADGWNPYVGHGVVDALAAVSGSTPSPVSASTALVSVAPSVATSADPLPRRIAFGGAAVCVALTLAGRCGAGGRQPVTPAQRGRRAKRRARLRAASRSSSGPRGSMASIGPRRGPNARSQAEVFGGRPVADPEQHTEIVQQIQRSTDGCAADDTAGLRQHASPDRHSYAIDVRPFPIGLRQLHTAAWQGISHGDGGIRIGPRLFRIPARTPPRAPADSTRSGNRATARLPATGTSATTSAGTTGGSSCAWGTLNRMTSAATRPMRCSPSASTT